MQRCTGFELFVRAHVLLCVAQRVAKLVPAYKCHERWPAPCLHLLSLLQADVNLGGRAGAGGTGNKADAEPQLQWTDFHLLAKAFRCGAGVRMGE